jgi:hypothetical protein
MAYKIHAAGSTPALEALVNAGGTPVGGVFSDGRSFYQAVTTMSGGKRTRKNRKQRKSKKSRKL